MKLHPRITSKRLESAVRRGIYGTANPGFCNACGSEQGGCEPDAEKYLCKKCHKNEVYGAELLLMHLDFVRV